MFCVDNVTLCFLTFLGEGETLANLTEKTYLCIVHMYLRVISGVTGDNNFQIRDRFLVIGSGFHWITDRFARHKRFALVPVPQFTHVWGLFPITEDLQLCMTTKSG